MVFANLSSHEKDAFFSLLDELSGSDRQWQYFSSRPDLTAAIGGNADAGRAVATSAVQQAFSRVSPQDVASAVTNGTFKRAIPSPSSQQTPDDTGSGPTVGRVAAAAAAFTSPLATSPRPPPRRSPSSGDGLVQQKKFGDVDISSGKAMFSSLRSSTANKTATPPPVAPPTPAAFARKSSFAPPPARRADSTVSKANSTPSPPPPPPPRPRQEETVEGDWAEVLYDYSSDDPGDLAIQTGERLLVVERTSDDWWMGELEGRRGLVPAAYVKLL